MKNIEEYRKEINEIDEKMAALFESRMKIARDIADFKREHALPIRDTKREAALTEKNRNLIEDSEIEQYYIGFLKNNIELSCAYQERILHGMKVGYSGIEGANAHIAAAKMFPDATQVAFPSFESAYKAAEHGEVDCTVLPLENSYAGDVGAVMDLAFSGSLFANRITSLSVEHNLLGIEGAKTEEIKTVVSHPQALQQCDEFIKKYNFDTVDYSNTAKAAGFVKEKNDPHTAAIASKETADVFGLKVLEQNIATSKNNTSRFAAFSRSNNLPAQKEKNEGLNFIMVFTVPNEAGALAMVLDIIGAHGYNMKNLKSRPMKGLMWRYYFYVEAEGNINSINGQNMLRELSALCDKLKLIGTYIDEEMDEK